MGLSNIVRFDIEDFAKKYPSSNCENIILIFSHGYDAV